jgi:hypothetical protein
MANQDITPWPCSELSHYPLDKHWTDTFPMQKLSRFRYVHILNATRSFFLTNELAGTYAQFRNYAFQQGAVSNANPMDMEFFYSMLTHDYPFFIGHKQSEIQAAFKIDQQKYQGMELLKASHFDLYRVERGALGLAVLQSMTNPGIQNAFISFTNMPKPGDYIFARLMPVGLIPRSFAFSAVEPWDTVNPEYVDDLVATFRKQYSLFCEKFPDTSTRAFMKICAYHFYEAIQSHEILPVLNAKLSHLPDFVYAQTISYIFTDQSQIPKLTSIPGAKPVDGEDKEQAKLVTVPICSDRKVPETLREAIISRDHRTIEVTMFMHDAAERFVQETLEPCFKKAKTIRKVRLHDGNEVYRSLRHLSLTT